MKDKTSRNLLIISLYGFSLSILTTVVRAILLFTAYEPKVGYFKSGFPSVFLSVLLALGMLCCFSPLVLIPRGRLSSERKLIPIAKIVLNTIPATAFLLCGTVTLIKNAVASNKPGILVGFLCILSTLYFVLRIATCFPSLQKRAETLIPWFCIVVIAALMSLLASAYFDMTVSINGPFTTLYLFSLLSVAVFLLGEMRKDIGKPAPRMHFVATLTAHFLCLPTAVGNLLFCLFGDTGIGKTISDPTGPILLLALLAFISPRLLAFHAKNQEK